MAASYFIQSDMYPEKVNIWVRTDGMYVSVVWLNAKGIKDIMYPTARVVAPTVLLRLQKAEMHLLSAEDRAEFILRFC